MPMHESIPVEEIIKTLMEGFKASADVKAVYGEPITAFDKTLIPVAKVGYGLGAGFGGSTAPSEAAEGKKRPGGFGGGGGGGTGTEPLGFLLVTSDEVRFIPVEAKGMRETPPPAMMMFPMIMGAIILAMIVRRRRRQLKEKPAA